MDVSIIIVSRDLDPMARECLDRCRALEQGVREILFLPDEPLAEEIPGVRVIPTGKVGPAPKRDQGAGEAQAEIIAFLDADAYPAPDWPASALPHFERPEVGAVGGPGITPPDDGFSRQVSGGVYQSLAASGPAVARYRPTGNPRPVDDLPSCNLLIRADLFRRLGGFQSRFWPGEDTLLCRDIRQAGFQLIYDPGVLVYHHRRTFPAEHLRQVRQYAWHRGHFARRFPENSRKLTYFLPSLFVLGWMAAGLAALAWLLIARSPRGIDLAVKAASVYVLILLAAGWRENQRIRAAVGRPHESYAAAVAAGILLTHFTYGWYFIQGLLAKGRSR